MAANANLDAFASATFVVQKGANKLQRPVAGGKVLAGVLRSTVDASNSTNTTSAGQN